jgi:hypothetical protein
VPLSPSDQITLVQAYRVVEGWGGLPADQTPAPPNTDGVTLYLPPGDYFVRREFADRADSLGRASSPPR